MKNIIKEKSFKFAVRIIKLFNYLKVNKKEYVIGKQLLKSGTSIGANIREALNAESKMDFVHKLAIAQKETDETLYWLELLKETEYLTQNEYDSIYFEAEELLKIIRSFIIKTKINIEKHKQKN